jgi:hypothetical protein
MLALALPANGELAKEPGTEQDLCGQAKDYGARTTDGLAEENVDDAD